VGGYIAELHGPRHNRQLIYGPASVQSLGLLGEQKLKVKLNREAERTAALRITQ